MSSAPSPSLAPAGAPRRGIAFAVGVVAVDAMGIGLVMPAIPELLAGIAGLSAAEAAPWGGWMTFAYAAAMFLCGPLLGDLSDRFGRRPVLLAALGMLALDYLIAAAAQSLWLLVFARALAGMAGATHATAAAYVADVTTPERRAAAFGWIGGGFGVGFVAGPALGGLLATLGPRAPFLAAALLCLAACIAGLIWLPESLPPERRRAFSWRSANPFGALAEAARLPGIGALLAASAIFLFAFNVYPAVWAFYLIELHGWTAAGVGLSLAAFGVCMGLAQAFGLGWTTARIGTRRTVLLGLAFSVLTLGVYAIGPAAWVIFAILPLVAIGDFAPMAMSAMMSARVAEDRQGRLQGVIASLHGLTAALAPPVFAGIFEAWAAADASPRAPGAPFALAAVLALVALAVVARTPRERRDGGPPAAALKPEPLG
ncbi:MFS transporter [Albimonas sp. CAU 1670]|uniref:MFS transporter n=1 Tax=Albimonas sp. CAU 1670 TaxID=3032599 RepID=UPI0023DBADF2|nr:MFS transporter [Albimonas sp. CAU 1670]MDF2233517.1 MFS transporter [Albimonas sp. CAU 1670]